MACASPAYLSGTHWFLFVAVVSFIATLIWIFIYFLSVREALKLPINWILTVIHSVQPSRCLPAPPASPFPPDQSKLHTPQFCLFSAHRQRLARRQIGRGVRLTACLHPVLKLTLRRLMSYIYIYMEHPFLMFLDHTQRRSTVGRTPLDE